MTPSLDFHLKKTPEYIPFNQRQCRKCGVETLYVLEAVGRPYTYPSCANFECQEAVKNMILAAMARDKVSA